MPERPLRYGWTTGACAAAAAKAAYTALLTGAFPDPVEVTLPRGQRPAFALATSSSEKAWPRRHRQGRRRRSRRHPRGARLATVRAGAAGSGITFRAGEGVGTVTRPGLAVPPGEPAINPVPRKMLRDAIGEVAAAHGGSGDVEIEIAIPGGEELAAKTSTRDSAWWADCRSSARPASSFPIPARPGSIRSIAASTSPAPRGLDHIAGATGADLAKAIQALHGLPEIALIDMGDFVGGMLKYVRSHPVAHVTIAGGVAKMTKLAQGMLDVHSQARRARPRRARRARREGRRRARRWRAHPLRQHRRGSLPARRATKAWRSAMNRARRLADGGRRRAPASPSRSRSRCSTAKACSSAKTPISRPSHQRRAP